MTYTTVPQKPYKYSIRSILQQQDKGDTLGKLACNKLDQLCPACQLFGTVNLDEDRLLDETDLNKTRVTSLKGKLAFGNGTPTNKAIPPKLKPVTLKPLGTPKQTYYPFYLLNNRAQAAARGEHTSEFKNYDKSGLRVGRKVYLHHQHGELDYQASTRTNLNATVHPAPAGSRFQFTIHFSNLSTYELGLLLYGLNMRYREEKTGFQLGMGKPLGLGSCRLHLKEVRLLNLEEHYRSFLPAGEQVLTAEQIAVLEQKYQHVQGANKQVDFDILRQNMDNHLKLPALQPLPPSAQPIEQAWSKKPYIHEYHFLSSLNVHSQLALNAGLVFAAGQTKGFEWYQEARKEGKQSLFQPKALENNFSQQKLYQLKRDHSA